MRRYNEIGAQRGEKAGMKTRFTIALGILLLAAAALAGELPPPPPLPPRAALPPGPEASPTTGGSPWHSGEYAYDGSGNIVKIGADSYLYDGVSRIVEGTTLDGTSAQSYTYDPYGNMLSVTTNGTVRSMNVTSATNRLTGASYDAAGNMLRPVAGSTLDVYTWDSQNRMTSRVRGMTTFNYFYTASGERIAVEQVDTVQGATRSQWTWSLRDLSGKVLREYTSTPSATGTTWSWSKDYIYRGNHLLATESPSGQLHYHLDHLGSTRLITNASAQKVELHSYYPFGEEATSVGDVAGKMRFTGHERDQLAGDVNTLDYMHARYYGPTLGRFLSVDPHIDIDANLRNPQRWNRYSYVSNNPINKVDPDGYDEYAMDQRLSGVPDDWERDEHQLEVAGTAAVVVASLFVPDPTDVALGIFMSSRIGVAATRLFGRLLGKSDELADVGKGLRNSFKGKTPEQIDAMFTKEGFKPLGPDPVGGKGGYVNPKTGRSYHIDPGGSYKKGVEQPHIDVNRPKDSKLPKKKYPLKDKLHEPN